ncbi:DNA polymerase-3 subunit delta [Sphingomonas vulcanisoli]|uniref:DNA-directed DNA polymerase n=1 Tax=Sphingomonas vulcanisoli TaxID=1658060 RepID=A0ABX0TPI6_9SPHN|nr:DNA polymerase III subunit delta [Sphingomonas vulcanisoli]NIJ07448.1 DNA polymerase-3 subunit delta [Sphingomonas vulcanisoli]
MKPAEARLVRALDAADPAIRLYVLHGEDQAGARSFADRLGKALGAEAERIDLDGATLRSDPARLADEAAAFSMFGGRRWIRVDPAGDECHDAVEALLQASAAGNPVVLIAPALRKDSRVVKAANASEAAIVHACYAPEGRDLTDLTQSLAREQGLDMRTDVAARLARSSGGDRAILASEIEKLALYLDAAPDRPKKLEDDALEALGAGVDEGDLSRLTAVVFGGDVAAADDELSRLLAEGIEGIPVLRALGRRALLLAQLGAQVAAGDSVDRVMETSGKSVFFKEQPAVTRALQRWNPATLATAAARIAEAERQVKAPGYPGGALVEQEVLAITRRAARRN